jgi:hypothetical protein
MSLSTLNKETVSGTDIDTIMVKVMDTNMDTDMIMDMNNDRERYTVKEKEKTAPPFCQPIGALQPVEGIFCKINFLQNSANGQLKCNLYLYSKLYQLNFEFYTAPPPSYSPAQAKSQQRKGSGNKN